MTATTAPADLTSPTGYCTHRNHKKCPYRPGGAAENGIALSDGGFYMCPCSCHMQQKHAVQGKRLQVSLAARKEAVAAEQAAPAGEPDEGSPVRKSVIHTPVADHTPKARKQGKPGSLVKQIDAAMAAGEAPAKGRPASPKSTESTPKPAGKGKASTAPAAKPQATKDKAADEALTTAEKKAVRIRMAAILREAADFYPAERAYIEAHWLKYIDPDLDKARRDAAAAK